MKRFIFGALALLLLIHPAWAEEKSADTKKVPAQKVEEIVVTATRLPEPEKEATSAVTVVRGEDIEKMNVETLPDVLRSIPELTVIQNGGEGTAASVFLRGGGSSQTLVMLDGVKVKSTTTGSMDFSWISVDDIERIEIVKGPQSTVYGSEAMAGVINIITKRGKGKPRAEVSIEAGSFGTYKPSVTATGGLKDFDYRLSASYLKTDGISSAKSGKERDGYKNAGVSGKFGLKKDAYELELTGKYVYDRIELDGFDFAAKRAEDDLNYIQRRHNYMLSLKETVYASDVWKQTITASTERSSERHRDPDTAFNNADIVTGIEAIDWQNDFTVSDAYTLVGGAEYRKERGRNKGNFEASVDNKAFYVLNKLKLFEDSLVVNAGLRYDKHETFGGKTTYRLGALYGLKPLRLKASWGTGFRAPALNELYFPFFGNTQLRPEKSRGWEAGAEADMGKRLTFGLTYFRQKYEDLIDTDPNTFTAKNIKEAVIKGVEASADLKVAEGLGLRAGYTYLDTEDKTGGGRLPRRPNNRLNLSASLVRKGFSMTADYSYVDERFDPAVGKDLAPYELVNLSGRLDVAKGIGLFARIENLFDEDYEEAGSYGTPGISFYGGIKAEF